MKPGFDALCAWPTDDADTVRALESCPVGGWLHAATHPGDWHSAQQLAARTGGALALGLHPWWAQRCTDSDIDAAVEALGQLAPAVIGEIGLDHHRARSPADRARQYRAFVAQLQLAVALDTPFILHVVRALPEVLRAVQTYGLPTRGGVIHGWTGGPTQATTAQGLGLHLSVGPLLLRSSGHKVRASVAAISRKRLLIESHGSPQACVAIAQAVGEIWGCTQVEALRQTGYNARRLYGVCIETPE